jgi:hypothetical protein
MRVVQITDLKKNKYGVPIFTPWAVRDSTTLRWRCPKAHLSDEILPLCVLKRHKPLQLAAKHEHNHHDENNEPQPTAAHVDVRASGENRHKNICESSKHDKTPKSEICHIKRLATQPSTLIPLNPKALNFTLGVISFPNFAVPTMAILRVQS